MEIKSVMKYLWTKKWLGTDGFIDKFYETLKKLTLIPLEFSPKKTEGENTSKLILQGQHYFSIKSRQTLQENYKPTHLMNTDEKIPNKTVANQNQKHIKKIIYYDCVGFIPECEGNSI